MKREAEYLKLYRKLRDDIVSGSYAYGTKLPGKRDLKETTGLSLVTVEHAIALLEEEGYVENRERSGCYVIYRTGDVYPVSEEKEAVTAHAPVLHEEEQFPLSVYLRAVRKVLADYGERLLEKPDDKGILELREAIRMYLARSRGIYVSVEQIIIGSGAEYLYSLIVQLLGRDRIYAIEDPSYEKIRKMYRANGVRIDPLKMGRKGILSRELARTPASVLHVTPYNSFPTGVTAGADKRREYIEWASKRDGVIIEDDYESEFTVSSKPEDPLFSIEPDHTVIYLNTFTKTIAPSLRIGYMVLPAEMVSVYEKKAGFYACTVSTLSQLVVAELISSGSFERHINKVRRQRRKQLKK